MKTLRSFLLVAAAGTMLTPITSRPNDFVKDMAFSVVAGSVLGLGIVEVGRQWPKADRPSPKQLSPENEQWVLDASRGFCVTYSILVVAIARGLLRR